MSDFYRYFKENMEALGLMPPPDSLFGTQQLAIGTISTLLGLIEKFGTKVTVMELVGAGTNLEKLAVVGAASSAYYVGDYRGIDRQSCGCDRRNGRRRDFARGCSL